MSSHNLFTVAPLNARATWNAIVPFPLHHAESSPVEKKTAAPVAVPPPPRHSGLKPGQL